MSEIVHKRKGRVGERYTDEELQVREIHENAWLDKIDNTNPILILDVANLNYIAAMSGYKKENDVDQNLITEAHVMSEYLKLCTEFKDIFRSAGRVIHSFESGSNWRYKYTEAHPELKVYKSNRGTKDSHTAYVKPVIKRASETLKTFIHEECNNDALWLPKFEGDDIVGVCCTKFKDDMKIIVSRDEDCQQLLNENTVIYNPVAKRLVTHDDPIEPVNTEYFMFEKCIRGDSGDGVRQAYPKVRVTRIVEAFNDPVERVKMMNHVYFDDLSNKDLKVGDNFKHNELLMNLKMQPNRDVLEAYLDEYEANREPKKLTAIRLMSFFHVAGIAKSKSEIDKILRLLNI